jgi:hypothetical protein
MFRKKRREPVEITPLKSYQVGSIKENKFWFIKLLLFFGFFAAIILFLPQINGLYESFIKGPTPVPSGQISPSNNVVTNNTTDDENTVIDEAKNYFNEEKSFSINNIVFSTIELNNNSISFSAKNTLSKTVDLEELNIFFEVYNENDNLLKRIAILGNLKANETNTFSFSFVGEANYYEIKEILEEDYTYIDLSIDDNNISTLTCTKNNEKIVYTFENEKLTKIKHSDNIEKSKDEYDEKYSYYNGLYKNYHSKAGISSSFSTEDEVLNFKLTVDYTKNAPKIEDRLYFSKDTAPRIVNFKVESWEYECS